MAEKIVETYESDIPPVTSSESNEEVEYDFISEPSKEFICPVTRSIMLNPHQTSCCGNLLSSEAAERLTRDKKPCPLCNTPGPTHSDQSRGTFITSLDKFNQRKILELKVRCHYSKNGCKWVGTLKDIERNHLSSCGYQYMSCEFAYADCNHKFLRKDCSVHMTENVSNHQLLLAKLNVKLTKEMSSKLFDCREETQALKQELEKKTTELDKKTIELKEKMFELHKRTVELDRKGVELEKKEKEVESHQEMLKVKAQEVQILKNKDKEREELFLEKEKVLKAKMQQVTDENERLKAVMIDDRVALNGDSTVLQEVVDDLKRLTALLEKTSKTTKSEPPPSPLATKEPKFDREVIQGLKEAWGVAVGGGKLCVIDKNGKFGLHVVDLKNPKNPVFSMLGAVSFTDSNIPAGKCWYPRGMALDDDLNMFVADTGSHRVLKFSPDGKLLASVGKDFKAGSGSNSFNQPMGLSVNRNGKIFICDCMNHRIQIMDSNLVYAGDFGEKGSGEMEFSQPWDVALDKQGNIYVVDYGNHCVKVFRPTLSFLKEIGKDKMKAPTSLCIDDDNNMYVTDQKLRKVVVYDLDGNFKYTFGKFTDPNGIAVDTEKRIYVSDNGGKFGLIGAKGRVQVYV